VADDDPAQIAAALVLAGGRATRLGGADKPAITVGGRSLLATVAAAAFDAGASRLVVVGPARPEMTGARVLFARENPPGAGPVPALRAGLAHVSEPWLFLLAADLPFLTGAHLKAVQVSARESAAGALLTDGGGRPQWLVSCWRTGKVRAALGTYGGASLGGLLAPLHPEQVAIGTEPDQPPPWLDCDTSDDLAAARAFADRPRKVPR
jgi:molybdopterin-guanine dinucleotide biosynthesis protein A